MKVADLFEAEQRRVVAILPGRFHPFHKGHASMYNALVSRYGRDNVWIATSNKVELPKSPFTFGEKLQMMQLAGIPADRVIETKNPYAVPELTQNFDPATTVLVFAVSQKDMDEDPRFSFKPKKDGSPGYLQPLKDIKDAEPMSQHGYITTVPTLDFKVLGKPMRSATQVRADYAQADDQTRKAIIKDLFGGYNEEVKHTMDTKLAGANESFTHVTEAFDAPYPMTWEHDEGESHDALVKLPDGTNLSVNFNVEYDGNGEEAWHVEFWRNNSLNATGEGDAQRIFATVLEAIKEFIKIEQPATIYFSASKQEETGDASESRARLYKALVSRYARSWGYVAQDEDMGELVGFTLTRTRNVNEGWKQNLAAAAVALSTAATPAQAGGLDALIKIVRSGDSISRISKDSVAAEIEQEIKNQMRTDASSQNSTWQGKRKVNSPMAPHLDFSKKTGTSRLGNQDESVSEGVGRIVPGVNTTVDVGPDELTKQAKKFGNKVDKDGRPPVVKTNGVIKSFNLGLTESLHKLDKQDPMLKSEVHVSGVGVYSIESLHKNLSRKFAELSEMMSAMSPYQAEQAHYLLQNSALRVMLDSLAQAYKDLESKRRKGGTGSRGIAK